VDLNRITAFVRVVEAGSFTAAAAPLGLRKSSVSRSVAALEADLGIRLLQRTTRKLFLTDAGRAFYDRTRDALAGIEDARQTVSSLGAEPRGVVRVSAPVDLARDLATVTAAFLRANVGVRVEAVLTARHVDLVEEGFDLAVRAGSLTDSSLHARRLGNPELGLFASAAYLDRVGRPRRLADLARHECVLRRAGSSVAKWRLSGPRGDEEVTVHGRADTDELAFVRGMVLAGFGIALLPVPFVTPFAETGEIERVLPRYAQRSSPVHIVWPNRRFEPAAVKLFREALAEALPRTLVGAGSSLR
jgi:DNA-binding transcriptional LysR family regulator